MHVVLLSYTPEPERTIAAAARLSTSSVSAAELFEKQSQARTESLLNYLLEAGHLSPFEHASFTFAIDGISRAASHQLVRHRMASYTQQSQRYVPLRRFDYVTPPSIASRPGFSARFHELVRQTHGLYCEMVDAGIAAEDARYLLPQAGQTRLVMTMNARELMHAASLRLCLRAQWEIVQLFEAIKAEMEQVAPHIAAELRAKCYRLGYCDERESCGLMPTR
jgi:thymidylate synthase (FAD)